MIATMQHNIEIIPIPAFENNYIWLIHNGKDAIVVDPGDANPVIETLTRLGLTLNSILITHHHHDHIGGVTALLIQFPDCVIYAPALERYSFKHIQVCQSDVVVIDALNLQFTVLDVPGHTIGHVAYVAEPANDSPILFCGDVLFGAGCGRVFDNHYIEAYLSLQKLATLPPTTKIYCTHEYTLNNIQFALTLEPNNQALQTRHLATQQLRKNQVPTLPSNIALELATNPFLRCTSQEIIASIQALNETPERVFTLIRKLIDGY